MRGYRRTLASLFGECPHASGAGQTKELAKCIRRRIDADKNDKFPEHDEPVTGVVEISPGMLLGLYPPPWMEVMNALWKPRPAARNPTVTALHWVLGTRQ